MSRTEIGLAVQRAGALDLARHLLRCNARGGLCGDGVDLLVDLVLDFFPGRCFGEVETARGVDVDLVRADRTHFPHDRFVLDGEAAANEVVLHPAAVQVVDVHPRLEFFDGDELDHGRSADVMRHYRRCAGAGNALAWPGSRNTPRRTMQMGRPALRRVCQRGMDAPPC